MASWAATVFVALLCVAAAAAVAREADLAGDASALQADASKAVSRRDALRARFTAVGNTTTGSNVTAGKSGKGGKKGKAGKGKGKGKGKAGKGKGKGKNSTKPSKRRGRGRSVRARTIAAQRPNTARRDKASLGAVANATGAQGNVQISRKLWVKKLVTNDLLVNNLTVRANFDVDNVMTVREAKIGTLAADKLVASILSSKSGTVIVDGDLIITNQHPTLKPKKKAGVRAVSFLAESVVLGGVPQWRLVHHDDFDSHAEGWSLLETSSCNGLNNFLGGHCKIGAGQVTKRFDNLPPHKQVKVAAQYHFLDKWAGETAFLKLGEHVSWAHATKRTSAPMGIDMCGSKDHPETHFGMPVEAVLAHSASFLEVTFGSTGSAEQSPCERSFGVDDVMVYVR